MPDERGVSRELSTALVASILRESRTRAELDDTQQRLTWRATAPLRSMTVARMLARTSRRFRSPRAVIDEAEILAGWRAAPEYWDVVRELRASTADACVGVLVHVHYPELWEPLRRTVSALPGRVQILVTATPAAFPQLGDMIGRDDAVELVAVPNVGRDMGGFFAALDLIADRAEWRACDAILRLHGKRSPHLPDGDAWRESLVSGLSRAAPAVVAAFRDDESLGVAGDVLSPRVSARIESSRTGFRTAWQPPTGFDWRSFRTRPFPVGGMFWFRPELIDEYLALGVDVSSFAGDSRSATDGETPHLLERVAGWWPVHRGYAVVDALSLMDAQVLARAAADSPDRTRRLVQTLVAAAGSLAEDREKR